MAAKLRVVVVGAAGRMGRAVIRVASEAGSEPVQLVGAVDAPGSSLLGADAGEVAGVGRLGVSLTSDLAHLPDADVWVDFSSPSATCAALEAAGTRQVPIVVGTTGLESDQHARAALVSAMRVVPVLHARNFSVGITVLQHLLPRVVELLGSAFDVEILEMHHKLKRDAPSGTAIALLEAVQQAREELVPVWGRHGASTPRETDEIGVFALRGGDVVGDHTVVFAGPSERLELTHRATNRDVFARGAVQAARWLVGRPAGSYDMESVLGLR